MMTVLIVDDEGPIRELGRRNSKTGCAARSDTV
jgi:hypothetical protein